MSLAKLTEEFATSLKYSKDYQLFSTHEGSRYKLLNGLHHLIKAYKPFINKVNAKGYTQYYDYNLSKHWELAISFISENFSEKVLKDFQELPKYENKLKYNNLAANVFDIGFQISREEKNKNKDTTVQQYNYLKYMVNCLENYGLHPNIQNRSKDFYGKYWLVVSHNFERKNNKRIAIGNLTKSRLLEEYITPFLNRAPLFLNGQHVPHANIKCINVAQLLLTPNELHLFKEKHNAKTDLQVFKNATEVTDDFLTTRKINENYALSKEIMGMVHPKFQKLIKNKFKIQEYSEAVLSVYKELNDIIKEEYKALSGEELDGIKLVSKVFNKNNPVFIFPPDLLTENHQKEQEGYHLMFIGVLTGIRNPHAHKNFNLKPKDALYKILLASHLLDKFENRSQ